MTMSDRAKLYASKIEVVSKPMKIQSEFKLSLLDLHQKKEILGEESELLSSKIGVTRKRRISSKQFGS